MTSANKSFSSSTSSLAGKRVLIDRVSRDSVSLSQLLIRLEADVRIAHPGPLPTEFGGEYRLLADQGVTIDENADLVLAVGTADILFVDLAEYYPPPNSSYIVAMRQRGGLVSTLSDLVLQISPVHSIGVTGSAGKSTTTNLIADTLRLAGRDVYIPTDNLADNPYLNYEIVEQLNEMSPPAWLVAELTNGHLEYMQSSPDVAIVTTLWPDHIGWHGSLEAYYDTKTRILEHQLPNQWAVLNHDDETSMQVLGHRCKGQVAHFSASAELTSGVYIKEGMMFAEWYGETIPLMPVSDVPQSRVYLENALAAAAAALVLGVPTEVIGQSIRAFRGLGHRLEFVGEVAGIRVFNDGIAMTPKKAAAGLARFSDNEVVLIAGGMRRVEYEVLHEASEEMALIDALCRLAAKKAKAVVVLGEGGHRLREHLADAGFSDDAIFSAVSVEDAAGKATAVARPGDSILFSPVFCFPLDEGRTLTSTVLEKVERSRADAS